MIGLVVFSVILGAVLATAARVWRCPLVLRWLAIAVLCKALIQGLIVFVIQYQPVSSVLLLAIDWSVTLAIVVLSLRDDRGYSLMVGGAQIAGLAGNVPRLMFGELVEPARVVLFDVPLLIQLSALAFAVVADAHRDADQQIC